MRLPRRDLLWTTSNPIFSTSKRKIGPANADKGPAIGVHGADIPVHGAVDGNIGAAILVRSTEIGLGSAILRLLGLNCRVFESAGVDWHTFLHDQSLSYCTRRTRSPKGNCSNARPPTVTTHSTGISGGFSGNVP